MELVGTVHSIERDNREKTITIVIKTDEPIPKYYTCTKDHRKGKVKQWYNKLKPGDKVFTNVTIVGQTWKNVETGEDRYFLLGW